MDRAVVTIPVFHEITQIVRILPPPPQNSMISLGKQRSGDDSGDSVDDSPGAKAAHKTMISAGAAPAGMDMHG